MKFKLLSRVSVLLLGVFFGSTALAAPGFYSVNAEGRTFSGNLLVLPIAGPAAGTGVIKQDPAINSGKGPITLTRKIIDRPPAPGQIGLWQAGGKAAGDVMSLRTSLLVQLPGDGLTAKFAPGLRSGPPVFNFCPGATQSGKTVFNGTAAGFNPNCTDPAAETPSGAGSGIANGILTYTATSAQFGGLTSLRVVGPVGLALMRQLCGSPYCSASGDNGLFDLATSFLSGTGVGDTLGAPADPLTLSNAEIRGLTGFTPGGIITGDAGQVLPVAGVVNTGWGGPLTTGVVSMFVTNNAGPLPLSFTLQGYDNRNASGIGTIQMVTGSVSQLVTPLSLSGGANRSYVRIQVTPEPTMLLGASGALAALVVSHTVVRRRSKKS